MTFRRDLTLLGLFLSACSGDDMAPPAGAGPTDSGAGGAHEASAGGGGTVSTGGRGGTDAGASGGGGSATGGKATGGRSATGGNVATGGVPGTGGSGVPDAGTSDASPEGSPTDGASESEAAQCSLPLVACPGGCVDLSTNLNHCGQCTHACAALEACINGSCTSAHCGTALAFAAEAEHSILSALVDGGSNSDGGVGAEGGVGADGGVGSEAGPGVDGGSGTGPDAGPLVVPNRIILAPGGVTGPMNAWIAASDGVYRALGTSGASLLSAPSLVVTGVSQSLSVAKIDGDSVLDLVKDSLTDVELLFGTQGSGFSMAGAIGVGDHEGSVLAVDIDGDQQNEIVVAALLTQDNLITLSIYKVPPFDQPTLWRAHAVPLGGSLDVYGVSAGHFDHDGYRDIALAAYGSFPALVTFANTPTELADPVVHALPDGRVRSPLVFDFNADGFDDVVAVAGKSIHFFAGSSAGLAANPMTTTPETSFSYADAAAADFDRDGKLDLALVRRVPPSGTQVVPAWGDGSGAFIPDFYQAIGLTSVSGIASGDVNDDGRPDLVTISADRGSVTAIRNECK